MPSNTTQIKHRQWLQVRRLMGAIVIAVVSLVWWSGYALNGIATMVHRRASRLRTGSNISHATRACRSTIVDESCAHNRVSVCYGREATRRLSTAGKRGRQAPCQNANRYGEIHAETQGRLNPRSALGRTSNWCKTCVRPLGGAHQVRGGAVARKERQRLLATVVEQVPPS